MMPPTSIDGTDITGATIDGTDVQEITVDGQTVFTAAKFVDDFEDGNKNEYVGLFQGSNVQVTNTRPFAGSFSLEWIGDGAIFSTSGLSNYPQRGDTYTVRSYHENTFTRSFIQFRGSSNQNSFGVYFPLSGELRLRKDERDAGGSLVDLDQDPISIPANEWLKVVIDFGNPTITANVEDASGNTLASVSASDSTSFPQGVGFGGDNNHYIDQAQIE